MSRFQRDQLTLAFRWKVAREMVEADMHVADGEQAWLERTFPPDALREAGFIDDQGAPTATWEACVAEALATLPDLLSPEDKRAILVELFRGTLADDDFHHAEGGVLVRTAQQLGVGGGELDAVLSALDEVGEVDLEDDEAP